jgi:hypothetical protein
MESRPDRRGVLPANSRQRRYTSIIHIVISALIAYEAVFNLQDFIAAQEGIHLLQSPAALSDGDGEKFYLHNALFYARFKKKFDRQRR